MWFPTSSSLSTSDAAAARTRGQVLVADDDPDLRALICAPLRRKGFAVIEAADGAELVEILGRRLRDGGGGTSGRSEDAFVLVSDVRMPKGDGLSITAALRRSGWTSPVVLITALDDHAVFEEATELSISAFFHKPFDPSALASIVERLALAAAAPKPSPAPEEEDTDDALPAIFVRQAD